jgi:hypothetical protein
MLGRHLGHGVMARCACPDARSAPSPFLVVLAVASVTNEHFEGPQDLRWQRATTNRWATAHGGLS